MFHGSPRDSGSSDDHQQQHENERVLSSRRTLELNVTAAFYALPPKEQEAEVQKIQADLDGLLMNSTRQNDFEGTCPHRHHNSSSSSSSSSNNNNNNNNNNNSSSSSNNASSHKRRHRSSSRAQRPRDSFGLPPTFAPPPDDGEGNKKRPHMELHVQDVDPVHPGPDDARPEVTNTPILSKQDAVTLIALLINVTNLAKDVLEKFQFVFGLSSEQVKHIRGERKKRQDTLRHAKSRNRSDLMGKKRPRGKSSKHKLTEVEKVIAFRIQRALRRCFLCHPHLTDEDAYEVFLRYRLDPEHVMTEAEKNAVQSLIDEEKKIFLRNSHALHALKELCFNTGAIYLLEMLTNAEKKAASEEEEVAKRDEQEIAEARKRMEEGPADVGEGEQAYGEGNVAAPALMNPVVDQGGNQAPMLHFLQDPLDFLADFGHFQEGNLDALAADALPPIHGFGMDLDDDLLQEMRRDLDPDPNVARRNDEPPVDVDFPNE